MLDERQCKSTWWELMTTQLPRVTNILGRLINLVVVCAKLPWFTRRMMANLNTSFLDPPIYARNSKQSWFWCWNMLAVIVPWNMWLAAGCLTHCCWKHTHLCLSWKILTYFNFKLSFLLLKLIFYEKLREGTNFYTIYRYSTQNGELSEYQ